MRPNGVKSLDSSAKSKAGPGWGRPPRSRAIKAWMNQGPGPPPEAVDIEERVQLSDFDDFAFGPAFAPDLDHLPLVGGLELSADIGRNALPGLPVLGSFILGWLAH